MKLSRKERRWLLLLTGVCLAGAFPLFYLLTWLLSGMGLLLCLGLLFPALCFVTGRLAGRHVPGIWFFPLIPAAVCLLGLWSAFHFAVRMDMLWGLLPGLVYGLLAAYGFWGVGANPDK